MQEGDLPAVLQVQAECFDPATRESPQSFLAKLAASPSTCFVAVQDTTVVGYLVAVPADSRSPPALNRDSFEIPGEPDCLYLHDLSVAPAARGTGVAEALIEAFLSRLKQLGFSQARLTAVNDSAAYWARHGFEVASPSGTAMDRVATYGEGARYMLMRVRPVGWWVWLFPLAYGLHIAEEDWQHFPDWASRFSGVHLSDARIMFLNGAFWLLMLACVLAIRARSSLAWLVVTLAAIVGVNAAVHLLGSLVTRSYSPGSVTAALLYLPLATYAIREMLPRMTRGLALRAAGLGVAIHAGATLLAAYPQ